jgi:hypothetical protein
MINIQAWLYKEHKLYAKLSKGIFYQSRIHYLGHIISIDKITIDPEKIESIRGWPESRNFIDVRSFMGLARYYQRFIKGFSSPITSFQKKGVKFKWNFKCEDIFQQLKYIITSVPILNIADSYEYFCVCMDACKEGIDGVLTQKYQVVCYEFRKLKEDERNYATHDQDLETIVHTLNM